MTMNPDNSITWKLTAKEGNRDWNLGFSEETAIYEIGANQFLPTPSHARDLSDGFSEHYYENLDFSLCDLWCAESSSKTLVALFGLTGLSFILF